MAGGSALGEIVEAGTYLGDDLGKLTEETLERARSPGSGAIAMPSSS